MGKSAYEQVASQKALYDSWHLIFKKSRGYKKRTSGIDGVSVQQFAQTHQARIADLRYRLQQRRFAFQNLKPRIQPEEGGKSRVICIPTTADRIVQRAILEYLHRFDSYSQANEINFGFIRGSSAAEAVELARQRRNKKSWAYKTDIRRFFDNIDRSRLKNLVTARIRARSLHPLLLSVIDCETEKGHPSTAAALRRAGIRRGKGLRQGMPLSPYLANLFLEPFDRAIKAAKLPLLRYADDIICFAESRTECENIHEFVSSQLEKCGLAVPPVGSKKSQIKDPMESVSFLGVSISPAPRGYELKVTEEQYRKITDYLFNFSNLDYLESRGITISTLLKRLDDTINGYKASYQICDNFAQVEQGLNDTRTVVLRRLFSNELGISVHNMSQRQKHFLEL